MKKKPLATHISISVTSMVIFSILVISGVLYINLSRSLSLEFEERIKAESGELSQIIQNQLDHTKNRLMELSMDNSVRVTLMLGADQQLQNHLDTIYGYEPEIRFFVATKELDQLYSTPGPAFDRNKILSLLNSATHTGIIKKDTDEGFTYNYSIPIKRQKGQIGIAACTYYFKKNKSLSKLIGFRKTNKVGFIDDNGVWDLFTGKPVNVSGNNVGKLQPGTPVYINVNNHPVLAVTNPELPEIVYAASTESLNSAKKQVFVLLFITSSIIILITIITSVFLSRKLTYPLNKLSKIAVEIAEGRGNLDSNSIPSNISEVERLMSSLNMMVSNIKHTEELKRYQELFEGVADSVIIHDLKGQIVDVNKEASVHFGFSKNELMEMSLFDITPLDQHDILKKIKKGLAAAETQKAFETEIITKNKQKLYTEFHSRKIIYGQKEVVLSVVRDFTERKQAEEKLKENEERLTRLKKMESLSILVGGVAHDLNNILSGIVSYPELILLDLPEDSKLRKPITTIQDSGNRAAAIVQDLLTVARGVAMVRESLNLNTIIKEYLLSHEFNQLKHYHSSIKIKTDLDPDLFTIIGSIAHIRKVIMNLVSNAAEAVDRKGNVAISTMNRYIDKAMEEKSKVEMGEYAVLTVSDDGKGISSDDLEKIFEPFYTKKVMGRSGTGLGLAVVWNIVQDLKGYIRVVSDDTGTSFEIYFPMAEDDIPNEGMPTPLKIYKGSGETILVVDDMESQREITCSMLERLGYKADAVSSGESAVLYLEKNTVDLVLLDMIMDPGISGRETYEKILKIHPNQKAIIVSGFAETRDVKEAQELGALQYIKKPFTLEKLGLAVKEELMK